MISCVICSLAVLLPGTPRLFVTTVINIMEHERHKMVLKLDVMSTKVKKLGQAALYYISLRVQRESL